MKRKDNSIISLIVSLSFLCFILSPISIGAVSSLLMQESQSAGTAEDHQLIAAFDKRVKEYVKMREALEEKLPKLSKEARPEEIETHKKSFQEMVRAARVNAQPGDIFTPEVIAYIRGTIKEKFKGKELQELREGVFEAETKGVPLRVNYPYPENKELLDMPPTLLIALPQLPKQLRYRFVGRHMLLVDRENALVVDYMPNALP